MTSREKKRRIGVFSIRDFSDVCTYSLLLVVSWILPARALWRAVAPVAIAHFHVGRHFVGEPKWLGEAVTRTGYRHRPQDFTLSRLRHTYHTVALLLQDLRPGGSRFPIELVGRENIDAGLGAGKGVILLVGCLAYSDLAVKKALGTAGLQVSHLSIPGHGGSGTRFGRAVTGRVSTLAENRYIKERILFTPDDFVRPLKTLTRRLQDNKIVSITAVPGASWIQVPFLGGRMPLGRAAPALSRRTGAALLPVLTFPSPSGGLVVRVGTPLQGAGEGTNLEESLACAFGAHLEELVRAQPTLWSGWPDWTTS